MGRNIEDNCTQLKNMYDAANSSKTTTLDRFVQGYSFLTTPPNIGHRISNIRQVST